MIRIALFAGPGAGKTTLAMAFTAYMKDRGYNWHYVHEYARDFIDVYGGRVFEECGPLVQNIIMDKQIRFEKKLPETINGFITDSPVFLSWIYGAKNATLGNLESYLALKNCYKGFLRSLTEYDLIIRVVREKPYMKDGTRSQSEEQAIGLDKAIQFLLELHGIKYVEVAGSTEERCLQIYNLIKDRLNENPGGDAEIRLDGK